MIADNGHDAASDFLGALRGLDHNGPYDHCLPRHALQKRPCDPCLHDGVCGHRSSTQTHEGKEGGRREGGGGGRGFLGHCFAMLSKLPSSNRKPHLIFAPLFLANFRVSFFELPGNGRAVRAQLPHRGHDR